MAEQETKVDTKNEYTRLLGDNRNAAASLSRQKSQRSNPPSLTRRMSSQFLTAIDSTSSTNFFGDAPNNFIQSIPVLSKQKSKIIPTYYCNICFTKYPIDEGYKLQNCQHSFCTECIAEYFTNKINDGIVQFKCFHPEPNETKTSCSVAINENDIHAVVTDTIWSKYNKFKSNLENVLSRQCPYCDNTQIGNTHNPIIKCNKCNKEYCLYHSSAHPMDMLCEQYELQTAKETKMNEMTINKMGDGAKPCPQCKFLIVKNGGCNHMNCVACQCSFCWLCMEVIENTELPNHYKDSSSQCNGKQFEGMEDEYESPRWVLCIMYTLAIVLCIPSLILAVVFRIICLPCYCICKYCGGQSDEESFCSLLWTQNIGGCCFVWLIILSMPLLIVLSVPMLIVYCIYAFIAGIYRGIRNCCSKQKPFESITDLNMAKTKALEVYEKCHGICTVGIIENQCGYTLEKQECENYSGKMVAAPPHMIKHGESGPFIHRESGCIVYKVLHNNENINSCIFIISWIIDDVDGLHEIDYEISGGELLSIHANVEPFNDESDRQFIWTISCDSV